MTKDVNLQIFQLRYQKRIEVDENVGVRYCNTEVKVKKGVVGFLKYCINLCC
jgi:hypothetical protein